MCCYLPGFVINSLRDSLTHHMNVAEVAICARSCSVWGLYCSHCHIKRLYIHEHMSDQTHAYAIVAAAYSAPCDTRHSDRSRYCTRAQNHLRQCCRHMCLQLACTMHSSVGTTIMPPSAKINLSITTEAYTQQSCAWIMCKVALSGAMHVHMCALNNMPTCCMYHCSTVSCHTRNPCKAADADMLHA